MRWPSSDDSSESWSQPEQEDWAALARLQATALAVRSTSSFEKAPAYRSGNLAFVPASRPVVLEYPPFQFRKRVSHAGAGLRMRQRSAPKKAQPERREVAPGSHV